MKIRCIDRKAYIDYVVKTATELKWDIQKQLELVDVIFSYEDKGELEVIGIESFTSSWITNAQPKDNIMIPPHEKKFWEKV